LVTRKEILYAIRPPAPGLAPERSQIPRTAHARGQAKPRFKSLLAALHSELDPQTEIEAALVETMAVARWRQMRLWALEKSALDDEIRRQDPDTVHKDAPTRAFLAFRGITDQSRSLELVNRYESRFDRQFLRLVRHFERIRTAAQNTKISKRTQEVIENKEPL
jgi:hypothetical protein